MKKREVIFNKFRTSIKKIKPGQGIVIGNRSDRIVHFHPIGTIVEILKIREDGVVETLDPISTLSQGLSPKDVLVRK